MDILIRSLLIIIGNIRFVKKELPKKEKEKIKWNKKDMN